MEFFRETDVAVIGDRVTGKAVLCELLKYHPECLLVVDPADVSTETGGNGKEDDSVCCTEREDARVIPDCAVTGYVKEDGEITIVNTTRGPILAKVVIRVDDIRKSGGSTVYKIAEMAAEAVRKKIYLLKKRS